MNKIKNNGKENNYIRIIWFKNRKLWAFIKRKIVKKLSKKDKENLHRYFKDLKFREPNIIDLGVVDFEDEIDEEFEGKIWECF